MSPRTHVRNVLPPLLLAGGFTAVAYAAVGPTTGLFFAGIVVATLLTPPLVLAAPTRLGQLLCAMAVVLGVALVETFAVASPSIVFFDWMRAATLLGSYALALCGLSAVLRLGLPGSVAAALVTTVSLVWLTWPIWLSPHLAGHEHLVGVLVAPHPLLALDAIFRVSGPPWSERYYMYNYLTVLNQDVAYELPRTIVPAVVLHGVIGAIAFLLSGRAPGWLWRVRRRGPGVARDVGSGSG